MNDQECNDAFWRFGDDGKHLASAIRKWHQHRGVLFFVVCLVVLGLWLYRRNEHTRRRQTLANLTGYKQDANVFVEKETPTRTSTISSQDADASIAEKSQAANGYTQHASRRMVPKRLTRSKIIPKSKPDPKKSNVQPLIFYFSLTESSTKAYATEIFKASLKILSGEEANILPPKVYDIAVLDAEDSFTRVPESTQEEDVVYFYTLLIPSYNIDTALDSFIASLEEIHNDFRIDTNPLSGTAGYSVFGFGDREGWPTENDGFCCQAIEVDKWMAKLTGKKRAFPLGLADVTSDAPQRFREWSDGVSQVLKDIISTGGLGEGVPGSGAAVESDEEDQEVEDDESGGENRDDTRLEGKATQQSSTQKRKRPKSRSRVDDLEDIGATARSEDVGTLPTDSTEPLAVDFTTKSKPGLYPGAKAMVPITSPTHAALTKQGYTIIGTHSGVKICRWTKSALRGRGSCYKFSFYGIKSHLCMETTPSLSCSNKCVFCWRHGTNPVGTTWRWQVDPPEMIFEGAKEGHYKKIKMMKGVPGVRAERFQEAMQIRHCALSLVGEPIFYPHINEFLAMLHKEHISSFLVCNAQHPDQLAALNSVTQLYVSIDASNAESLRKIDRPLHRDYWERFMRCLDILRERRFRMRTVYRLTLVKGFNIEEEVEGYADLVAKGLPCFVEIKGVTYCGTSSSAGAGLTMQNVPFYEEIVTFVEALNTALQRRGLGYGIAAEHAHSCCVLIASTRFFINERWHTLIDYDQYFTCLESGEEFRPEDYMGPPTPEWATWGKGGFDPADQRVDRKGRPKE